MARLFDSPTSTNDAPVVEEDLPGLGDLPSSARVQLGLAQADDALNTLAMFLHGDAKLPDTRTVRAQVEQQPDDAKAIRTAILTMHVDLLLALTAADFRLGKAYGLGRALADSCLPPPLDDAEEERRSSLRDHLERHRVLVLIGWLDDLKSILPDHAAQAVADSLGRWVAWAENNDVAEMCPRYLRATIRALHRQGQRWRALLSAEKDPRDLLEIDDYLRAGRGLLRSAGRLTASFAKEMALPLVLSSVLLIGGFALVLLAEENVAQVLAGLGTVAAGLGITLRSATSTLGHLAGRLGEPLWNAELDKVMSDRLTRLPELAHADSGRLARLKPSRRASQGG